VLTLVFQDGLGEKTLGFTSVGGIAPWLPLFLFVILFTNCLYGTKRLPLGHIRGARLLAKWQEVTASSSAAGCGSALMP
jgi:hypothetical protein